MNTDKTTTTSLETVTPSSDRDAHSQESAREFALRAAAERRAEHKQVTAKLEELTSLAAVHALTLKEVGGIVGDRAKEMKELNTNFGNLAAAASQVAELGKAGDERLEQMGGDIRRMALELEAMRARVAPQPPVGGWVGQMLNRANELSDRVLGVAKPLLVFGGIAAGAVGGGVAAKNAWDRRQQRLAAAPPPPSFQVIPPMTVSVNG